jgi:hypothetical protein
VTTLNAADVKPMGEIWDQRPELHHVCAFARSRRAAPWAVLGALLVRAIRQIPPWATLPPLIGGRVAVNLFTALTGESGTGKGGAGQPRATRSSGTTPRSSTFRLGH